MWKNRPATVWPPKCENNMKIIRKKGKIMWKNARELWAWVAYLCGRKCENNMKKYEKYRRFVVWFCGWCAKCEKMWKIGAPLYDLWSWRCLGSGGPPGSPRSVGSLRWTHGTPRTKVTLWAPQWAHWILQTPTGFSGPPRGWGGWWCGWGDVEGLVADGHGHKNTEK